MVTLFIHQCSTQITSKVAHWGKFRRCELSLLFKVSTNVTTWCLLTKVSSEDINSNCLCFLKLTLMSLHVICILNFIRRTCKSQVYNSRRGDLICKPCEMKTEWTLTWWNRHWDSYSDFRCLVWSIGFVLCYPTNPDPFHHCCWEIY